MAEAKKMWGTREFWGVGWGFDAQWFLTEEQKQLQKQLIELCRTTLRPNATVSDETYEYPKKNMNALADLRLLGLIVPKELGGRGESHQCYAMVVETIARYGCPSTALVYVMHITGTAYLLYHHHNNEHIKDLMRRLDKDKLIGTTSIADESTGGHFWYLPSNKCWRLDDGLYKVLKYASWGTSNGFADFYYTQVVSPDFKGNYANISTFLFYPDEIRANTDDWSALGMHGNHSGPCVFEATVGEERRVGPEGSGAATNYESGMHFFFMGLGGVFNGIAMGSIDLAKRHVLTKTLGDAGLRVGDYPAIQSYVGEAISETNACRSLVSSYAFVLDKVTNNNDWSIYKDGSATLRTPYYPWGMQIKLTATTNVNKVTTTMLKACGGTGYKTELGIERLLRDGLSGCVNAVTNEVLLETIGKLALMGPSSLDFWGQVPDERVMRAELRKLNADQKIQLAERLMAEAKLENATEVVHDDKFDFDNPLSSKPPRCVGEIMIDGVGHKPALMPESVTSLKLMKVTNPTNDYAIFTFEYPDVTMHSGCHSGQYIEMKIPGSKTDRYISPTSDPCCYGNLEMAIKYEGQGVMAEYLKQLSVGDKVSFRGPCGGLEYSPNLYSHIVFLCGGIGVTPAIQIVRSIVNNPKDTTRVTVFYQAKNADELLYQNELDGYTKTAGDKLNIVYTLQNMDDAWNGSEGYIDFDFLSRHMPAATKDGSLKVVVCGGGNMITVCVNSLSLLKFKSDDIFVYGPFAAEQIRSSFGRNIEFFKQ